MWSGPRNISTTVMYSFGQRNDTEVVDEPLYAHYINQVADLDHPGIDEVLASQPSDAAVVLKSMLSPGDRPVRFFKNMGHHLLGIEDWGFLDLLENFVLTRHPAEVIQSLTKHMKQPTLRDLGYSYLVEIVSWLESRGIKPTVVVSSDILANPGDVLAALCERLGLAWDPAMLAWEAGPRPEDGVWAKHWYHGVHSSIGFRPPDQRREPLADEYQELLSEALPLYERLMEHSLTTT